MENIKRPTTKETDEDLLEQQKKFLKKIKPSAKYVSCSKSSNSSSEENQEKASNGETLNQLENEKHFDVVTEDIVFDVKERDVSLDEPFVFRPPPLIPKDIRQKLMKLKLPDNRKSKSQSIFAELLNSSNCQALKSENKGNSSSSSIVDGSGLQPLSKDTEIRKIHEENLMKLSTMSADEIFHHQEELKKYLKPEILDFIKGMKTQKLDNSKSYTKIEKRTSWDLPGEIIRKEGNEDCDALICKKVFESQNSDLESQENGTSHNNRKAENESNIVELPEETTELIKGTKKGLWRNMNKIEKEKLKWMTDLPQPKAVDLKTGYAARFDFEGKLLSREADIPTYEGLHHHGNEPEIPGYSLEELFLLARSSLQSQRITALNTIAHILENNWCGMMDACFDTPLLPLMLNAGIVPLLRWALDDTPITSISATISAIHSLLISKADEACSNKTYCWLNGHFVAQLEPQGLDEPNIVLEELTDADLINLDVVKGFLRIDILPRFMYILKVMCPPPLVCKLILEICARLAQHSPESAKQVATHPGLLDLVFEKFVPLNWNFAGRIDTLTDTVGFSCPMDSALKMLRIIISSDKKLAFDMLEKYDLIPVLTFYITIQPLGGKLAPQEVQPLILETLKLWNSFLCYGLSAKLFLNLFPIFVKHLEFFLHLNINCDTNNSLHDFDYAIHLFKCFEAVAIISSERKDDDWENTEMAIAVIYQHALNCLQKWIWQFSREKLKPHGMTLLAGCMNFVVTCCRKSHKGIICTDWKPCSDAKKIFEKKLLPTLKSNTFQSLLNSFRSFSLYLTSEISGNKRDGKTIVSLGSVLYGGDIVPILKEDSPLPLLTAILNYILFYTNSFQGNIKESHFIEIVFGSPMLDYLKAISVEKLKKNCWFLKFESYFIYQLIQLASVVELAISHETAISILHAFTSTEGCLVEDLFENIIFNQEKIQKLYVQLSSQLSESTSLDLLTSRLPVISQCFISCFLDKSTIINSRNMLFRNSEIDSLFSLSTPSAIVPKDWCFMPILYLYKETNRRKERCLSPEEILQVCSSLQWIDLCHLLNLQILKNIPASVEFYYLCLVFLLDENLFRDQKVKDLLVESFSLIMKQKTLNLTKINWNDIKSFDDIYLELLMQYEAVSYGDETFGSFLVVPLQQCCPKEWKKLLLTEHLPIFRFFRIPLRKLLVPVQNFLEPIETDTSLLFDYFKVLASGILDHRWCPLLHLMAIHHIHHFIFTNSETHRNEQKKLLLQILKSRKDLQKKILFYQKVDITSEYGFTMTEELSSEKRKFICDLTDQSVHL